MKKVVYIFLLVISAMLLGGCGSGSSGQKIGTTGVKKADPNRVQINSLKISKIGDAKIKYKLDNLEVNATDILENIGNSPTDLSNEGNFIAMDSGLFYRIDLNFETTKKYPKGVDFAFSLIDEDKVDNFTEDDYHKLIYYKNSGNLEEIGKHTLQVDIFLATDIPIAKYALVVNGIDEKSDRSISNQTTKNIKDMPMTGATYIEIFDYTDAKRAELVNITASKYVDLPTKVFFKNGHSNNKAGSALLYVYNTSDKDEEITISAQLELENGELLDLALLDNNKTTIKNKITYTLPTSNNYILTPTQIGVTYYILQEDYASLLKLVPDLSVDKDTDGLKGKVIWNIQSTNSDLVTNSDENSVLITKYIDNYYIKLNKILESIGKPSGVGDIINITRPQLPNLNIADYLYTSTKIDAAFDYDEKYAYLITGNKKIRYDKQRELISKFYENNWLFVTTLFDKIDASFKYGDFIFFFSGDKYIKYNYVDNYIVDGSIKKTKDLWKGVFNKIDAVAYHKGLTYFFSGDKYIAYNSEIKITLGAVPIKINLYNETHTYTYEIFGINEVYTLPSDVIPKSLQLTEQKNIKDKWGGINKVTAAFSDGKDIIFFNNRKSTEALDLSKKYMFKYGGKVDEATITEAYKYKWGIYFKGDYNIRGTWRNPGVVADAKASIGAYIFSKHIPILKVVSEAEANIGKIHPALAEYIDSMDSRIGGKIAFYVLGNSKIYSESSYTPTSSISEVLDLNNLQDYFNSASDAINNRPKIDRKDNWGEKVKIIDIRFIAGFIPIHIAAGVRGTLGIETSVGLNNIGVAPRVYIPTTIHAWASGGVDVLVAKAEVMGDVTLIELGGENIVGGKLNMIGEDLSFTVDSHANFVLNLIKATLYAKGKLWIPLMGWKEKRFSIFETDWLYNRKWTIFDTNIASMPLPL